MNGAGALLEILNGYGVDHIFCSPGSEWPPLWEELARRRAQGERAPEYLNVRHEEVAVAMASGYAKATGRLSAVIVHTTVGTLHAGMAIRAAFHEELPMLVCAGESIDFGEKEGFDPGGQWIRYLADRGGPTRFAEPCAKWCMGVISKPTLASTLHRACQIAMTPPRGPVFVSLPFEFLFEDAAGPIPTSYPRPTMRGADVDLLDQAAHMLASSRRPLLITDAAGRDIAAVGELVRLAELLAAPVIESTRQMYFNFPRDHPLHGGVDPRAYLEDADAVLLVGAVAPWHPPSAGPGKAAKIVALDSNPLRPDLPYSGYRVDLSLTGEIGISLAGIVERARAKLRGSDSGRQARIEELKARHDKQRQQWREEARKTKDVRPIDPRWLCHVLNSVLPDGATVVEETITHRGPIVSLLDRLSPGRYFGAESGGLGLGMGIALGLKCVSPDKSVVTLIGDGTFNYNPVLAALGFSQEYGRPTVTVIMNNAGYLSMKRGVTALYPHGFAARTNSFFGWPIQPNPKYAAIAQAFDAYGETVEDPADVEPALRRAFEAERSGRSALIDVHLSPDA
jgi:thiamine pyrophosphate-dependent acetolactate synthase large subunit-like protein